MFPYTMARKIAEDLVARLAPHCERIDIAGSLRREMIEVKDIEIVCRPKKVMSGGQSLFNDEPVTWANINAFKLALRELGKTIKGTSDGRYMQMLLTQNIKLDLFMPKDYDYFRQLVIRTGSVAYIQGKIAPGWRKLGWVGTEDGLRREEQCEPKLMPGGATKWTCLVDPPTLPPVWQSEREFFAWLQVTAFHPKYRV